MGRSKVHPVAASTFHTSSPVLDVKLDQKRSKFNRYLLLPISTNYFSFFLDPLPLISLSLDKLKNLFFSNL